MRAPSHPARPVSRRLIAATITCIALAAGLGLLGFAVTAANTVPATNLSASDHPPGVNDLKPAACDGVTYTARVVGSGTFGGTNAAEVLLGSAGIDDIGGAAGTDCIVGGGGNDTLNGGAANDIIIGGPGNDALDGAAGTGDVCYGGTGTNTFARCETIL